MKKSRHEAILSIIENNCIETHEELAVLLAKKGFSAAQATISRDIRQLKITKITDSDGKQKYVAYGGKGEPGKQQLLSFAANKNGDAKGSEIEFQKAEKQESIKKLIKDVVVSVECAGNLLVFKTLTGMGMAAAVNIDMLEASDILGTIAGDDVVFCAVKSDEQAKELKNQFAEVVFGEY